MYLYAFMSVHMCVCVCLSLLVDVREQLIRVCSHLLSSGYWYQTQFLRLGSISDDHIDLPVYYRYKLRYSSLCSSSDSKGLESTLHPAAGEHCC